ERARLAAVVVQVHFALAEPRTREIRERVEELGTVLLAREEERVSRMTSVGIDVAPRERRIALVPRAHALPAVLYGRVLPERLVVIAEREQEMTRALRA